MHDAKRRGGDQACLFEVASEQHGYFTTAQARKCGFSWDALRYHARGGRFIRIRRALYRLRDYPFSPEDDVMAAWLAVGKDVAVVSHETALDLLDLGDVIPNAIHLTIPRSRRYHTGMSGVDIHTTTRPLRPGDVITREDIRLTSATRTILDAAETGTGPEQIETAVHQAIRRGLALPDELRARACERGGRVYRLIATSLEGLDE
jgi:predicted transcriptional regulator of viral defense system